MSEELDRIYGSLKSIDEKLTVVLEWKGAVDERCCAHTKQTEELRDTVFGIEPNPGLKGNVAKLMNCKSSKQKSSARVWSFLFGLVKGLMVVSIVAIVAWLLTMWKSH